MNSIYGAIGNAWFVCFNPDVAEAVTIQGQDLIKHSEKILHKYFHEYWHIDKELHEIIGLKSVRKVVKPLVVYGDTDSNYVSFQDVIASCDWEGDPKDLILLINKHRLNDYLKKCFDIYSEKWGTDNYSGLRVRNPIDQRNLPGKEEVCPQPCLFGWSSHGISFFPKVYWSRDDQGRNPFFRERKASLSYQVYLL